MDLINIIFDACGENEIKSSYLKKKKEADGSEEHYRATGVPLLEKQ